MASYEEVLHLLRYRNWHTRSLLDRKFKLICSELNGRYLSNEFKVEVSPGSQPHGPAAVVPKFPDSVSSCWQTPNF
jgi:hypothetical protein